MKKRLPFPILHEDRDLIVIDKPAGLLTASLYAHERDTAERMLEAYVRKGQLKSSRRVYLVHRLDRETSGVMMFAKSAEVAGRFRDDWHRLTRKIYLARVEGVLDGDEGVFESYLFDDQRLLKVHSVTDPKRGKFARTRWRRLAEANGITQVEVTLETGRKNQIRVHFSEAGHPIVGDVKYGARKADRLYLHACSLEFVHPHTHKWMKVVNLPAWRTEMV